MDDFNSYGKIGTLYAHETVSHGRGEYVRGDAHSNSTESFWALLKRGYYGTYHVMSAQHLSRYVDEFAMRHNACGLSTKEQMTETLAASVGKILPYKEVDGVTKRIAEPIPANFTQIVSQIAKQKVPDEFTVVSLFSGCGGLDMGFLGGFKSLGKVYDRLPYRIVWANDIQAAACKTYEANLKHKIHCGDVWAALDTLPKRADIVVGGFPCQDVSINGKMQGADGVRTTLYKAMIEAVRRTDPLVFVAENVKGLLMTHSKDFYEEILSDFRGLGYQVSAHLYLAADYGVPQMRERVFIVGTKGRAKPFVVPQPVLKPDTRITAKQAIDDLRDVPENPATNHIWSRAKATNEQGSRVLKPDRPADTMRAECHGNIQFHYDLKRRISMREAARIQSFPDSFIFGGGLRETERQVGNAVPPVLAWHIAKAVRDCLV